MIEERLYEDLDNTVSLGFFLGAGASRCAGYPLISDLTNEVEFQLSGSDRELYRAALTKAGTWNVESALGVLSSYLVTGWADQGAPAEQVRQTRLAIQRAIFQTISSRPLDSETHVLLCRWLKEWAQGNSRHPAPVVFTTNYDTLLEAAADKIGLQCEMGISGQTQRRLDVDRLRQAVHPAYTLVKRPVGGGRKRAEWVPRTSVPIEHFVLTKLHGSVAWEYDSEDRVVQTFPYKSAPDRPVIIYPEPNKEIETLSFPYRVLIDTLAHWLRQEHTTTLILNGYSFGDQHLNRWIVEALRESRSLIVWLLVKSKPTCLPTPLPRAMRIVTESGCIIDGNEIPIPSNLWDFEQLVNFLGRRVFV